MALIVSHLFQKQREIRRDRDALNGTMSSNQDEEESSNLEDTVSKFKQTNIITKQAIMYIAAHFVTHAISLNLTSHPSLQNGFFRVIPLILRPPQGLWTAVIFINHKVSAVRQSNENLTFYDAMILLLRL